MKRVIVDRPNSYKIIEEEKPQIKDPHDVIVKMKSAGVCGSCLLYTSDAADDSPPV